MDSLLGTLFGVILQGVAEVGARAAYDTATGRKYVSVSELEKNEQKKQPQQQPTSQFNKQTSVQLPCITTHGALDDFIYVVIGYEQLYSNPLKYKGNQNCFVALPNALKQAHRNMIHELVSDKALINAIQILSNQVLHNITKPNIIGYACTPLTALTTYKQMILDYQSYSGRGCWSLLPTSVKTIMCKHINLILCPLYNRYDPSHPCKYKCSTSYQLFRSRFGGINNIKNKEEGTNTDWSRYTGLWYEHARVPSWFESKELTNATATYSLQKTTGEILVHNRALDSLGNVRDITGTAIVDPSREGVLLVSFFPLVYSPYVVLDHDSNYTYSIVAGAEKSGLIWLLTRQQNPPSAALWEHFLITAKNYGIELQTIQKTTHIPGAQVKTAGSSLKVLEALF